MYSLTKGSSALVFVSQPGTVHRLWLAEGQGLTSCSKPAQTTENFGGLNAELESCGNTGNTGQGTEYRARLCPGKCRHSSCCLCLALAELNKVQSVGVRLPEHQCRRALHKVVLQDSAKAFLASGTEGKWARVKQL